MTSGVLVCIKNKNSSIFKKEILLYVHRDVQCLGAVQRNRVNSEHQQLPSLPALPLTCLQPTERETGEHGP